MKLSNAIKKAEKVTGIRTIKKGQFYTYKYKGWKVQFAQNGDEDDATCFYTIKDGHKDDLMIDYFAGTFHDNLTRCFNFIDNY